MKRHTFMKVAVLLLASSITGCRHADRTRSLAADKDAKEGEWIQLFNGRDLKDWVVKLNHHALNDNYGNTFRVEDGMIKVRYDQYGEFGDRFGHLYYKQPFSHYRLAVEYRFVGTLQRGAPGYAVMNSGVMLHSQDPKTILVDQNWPISIEFQFLAGLPDGKPRATGCVCTPGTHVVYNGTLTEAHIIQSNAETYQPGSGFGPRPSCTAARISSTSSTGNRCWNTASRRSAAGSRLGMTPRCSRWASC